MEIKLEDSFTIDEPIDKVWEFLSDPQQVAPCLPGAEILEVVSETEYKGAVKLKLGPFSAQFKGEVVVEHMDAASHEIRLDRPHSRETLRRMRLTRVLLTICGYRAPNLPLQNFIRFRPQSLFAALSSHLVDEQIVDTN